MNPRPAAPWLAPALALTLAGCGSTPWTVVRQANPNPFPAAHARAFAVAPAEYEGLHVGPNAEAVYLAGKPPAEQSAWESAKRELGEHVASAARATAPEAFVPASENHRYVVRPFVTFIDPGSVDAAGALPTEVQMTVQITTRAGEVLDTFSIGTGLPTTRESTVAQRLERAGDNLGGLIARYVRERSQ